MAKDHDNQPSVFISYSHKDEAWKDHLRSHLGVLENTNRITVWDDRHIDGSDDWYPAIKEAMEKAAVAVCLISPDYLKSKFIYQEEIPALIKRREKEGMILLPVLVRPCLWEAADWLSPIQMIPRDGQSISHDFKDDEDTPLTDVAKLIFKKIDDPDYQPPAKPQPDSPALPDSYISLERLPQTGIELFGRSKELAVLDELWESQSTNIASFVAYGGVGKSTLINKWLAKMQEDNFRGAQRVYGWSFYSQGTGHRITSADTFINESLQWFGDPKTARSNLSAWEKGGRLAELIRAQKTLLILDGLEPLQSDFKYEKGIIKDPALAVMLDELAKDNPGLCIITTRENLVGVNAPNNSLIQQDLELISSEAGRSLLRVAGIKGNDAQLEQASEDFGNHALAIRLLAAYLQDVPGRHIDNASSITDLDISEEDGKHPRRIMEAFVQRFGPGPELNILNIMGLFDRPATTGEIKWLRTQPEVEELTDHIHMISDDQWNQAVTNLRHANLIAPLSHHEDPFINDNDPHRVVLDAHPHIRTHFDERLKTANLDSWKQGHLYLYDYLPKTVPHLPGNIEEMTPLYRAVYHGCAAGLHQQALINIYVERIQRGRIHFNWHQLGAFGSDLAAITCFFVSPWHEPSHNLNDNFKGFVLNDAAFDLRALGLLAKAVQPFKAGLDMALGEEDWTNSTQTATNLSELYLTLGHVDKAIDFANQCIAFVNKGDDDFLKIAFQTTIADTLAQAGKFKDAQNIFIEAENMQKKLQPDFPFLLLVEGYQYCSLLLGKGEYDQVIIRATKTLQLAKKHQPEPLPIALDNLSLGCAHLQKNLTEDINDFTKAGEHLNASVDGLRKAGQIQEVPRGLIARAKLYRVTNDFPSAHRDLNEAYALSTRIGAKLLETDCCLEYARLHLADGNNKDIARKHLKEAESIITETGYHRRDKDLADLRSKLK